MNILAIGAHPDDIEILCAGTLALYARQGHTLLIAAFTSGNMGDRTVPPDELAAHSKGRERKGSGGHRRAAALAGGHGRARFSERGAAAGS